MTQRAIWLPAASIEESTWLVNQRLEPSSNYDEKWLQELLFARPALIPIDAIDAGSPPLVSVCRELSFPSEGRTGG